MEDGFRRYRTAIIEVAVRKDERSRAIDRINVLVGAAFVTLFLAILVGEVFGPGTDLCRMLSLPLAGTTFAIAVLLVLEVSAAIGRAR